MTPQKRCGAFDLQVEFADPIDRNLLSVASNPRFADRCLNWDEAIGAIVAVFKAHDWSPEHVEDPGPYFAGVMERFLQGDPKYVRRFLDVWESAPSSWNKKVRWTYPIVWNEPGVGVFALKRSAAGQMSLTACRSMTGCLSTRRRGSGWRRSNAVLACERWFRLRVEYARTEVHATVRARGGHTGPPLRLCSADARTEGHATAVARRRRHGGGTTASVARSSATQPREPWGGPAER